MDQHKSTSTQRLLCIRFTDFHLTNHQNSAMSCEPPRTKPAKRSRGWVRSATATTLAAISISLSTSTLTVSAFSTASLPWSTSCTGRPISAVSRNGSSRQALTDPDTLLRESIRRRSVDLEALENVYSFSADYEEPSRIEQNVQEMTGSVSLPKRKQKSRMLKPRGRVNNRSSTMPGFGSKYVAGREKMFQDGIRLIEQRSGRELSEKLANPKARKERRKKHSEAMYKTSASVPESLVRFANEIHLEDRISPKEEVELGEKTQEAIRLQSIYDNLQENLDRDPTDEEWCAAAGKINMEAISQTIDEGLEAKNRLVTSNLRMVQGVVNIYIRNGLGGQYNAGDMMQEGVMALIRAAEKFDPDRGFRFSTYAMYWIRSAVKRSQIFQSRVITIPQRLYENYKRLQRIEKELIITLERKPTNQELGDAAGLSERQVERCLKAMEQRCYSLDGTVQNKLKPNSGDPDKNSMYELVAGTSDESDYGKIGKVFIREDLIETLNRYLDPNQVELLLLRYGLMDEKILPRGKNRPLTIAEVSQIVGLKPDKVRRTINNALKELRRFGDEWRDLERELDYE